MSVDQTPARNRRSFSLLTLVLLIVIAALVAAYFAMRRELQHALRRVERAEAEVDEVRKSFGYIRVTDPDLVYVAEINKVDSGGTAYRLRIPPGNNGYLLHFADTEIPDSGYPENPTPTQTLSMNTWKSGADVILKWDIYLENQGPRLVVATNQERLFNYRLHDWFQTAGMSEGSQLQADPQKSFASDETIHFMYWRNAETKRGVMIWLEPRN